MQPLPEPNHIWQTFQTDFDRMLCNVLGKYHSSPGFTLLLGGILQYRNVKYPSFSFPPGMVATLYLIRQQGEGHILDDMGLSGIITTDGGMHGTLEFLAYFIELLENPKQSETHVFDQHKYATAAKECLQLCLCSHHRFSKRATQPACHDKLLLRNAPWAWKARLGIHSRIRKAMHHLTIQQWRSLKARTNIFQFAFPKRSSERDYYRFLSYQWRLDLLPIFLEKSAPSLELADMLRTRTFTMMAQRFPRKMKLAREAITNYLVRVESQAVGGP